MMEESHRFQQEDPASHPRLIKVKVVLSVTVDVDDYTLNYGVDSVDQIRRDVRAAIADSVRTGGVLHDGIVDCDEK